ncbi:hypothetical protein FA13DRAFT_1798470 [Coprinellus micaceus]|uniref:Uncharacterized protein n=1 Tax=Coprinellus micaceus TaxID=71717 RepID=A0A4Y7SM06_COPMI|nr:hypothetical protein FA13DRAFT_1798470 [Coprinellus micaceus]
MADKVYQRLATPHSSAKMLRGVLELVATRERRTARRLVVLSRAVQQWIDPILYHTISLSTASSTHALWKTISESSKPASFYAENVKNLSVSGEAHTTHLAQVLFVCTGITSLTFWSIPASTDSHTDTFFVSPPGSPSLLESLGSATSRGSVASVKRAFNGTRGTPGSTGPEPTAFIGPRLFLPVGPAKPSYRLHPTFTDGCFDAIRPRRLVASFRSDGAYAANSPDFTRPVFSYMTHLSILNKSEEWSFWDIAGYLPSLTHLALDLNVSSTALGSRRSGASQGVDPTAQDVVTRVQWLGMASTIKGILHKCRFLCVCVVIIQFAPAPRFTMATLARALLDVEA